ncbi:hypothetical protein, partial [Frankia sp. CiP1_Cm_nod2]|uniref:hypothetical protein n=1 Tax=Frankia sp. CiP1_Cm_nod2 TaxID=2897161 RepID=UPI0020252BFD
EHVDTLLARPPAADTAAAAARPAPRLLAAPDLLHLVDLRAEHADTWARNRSTPTPFILDVSRDRLPYALRRSTLKLAKILVWTDATTPVTITIADGAPATQTAGPATPAPLTFDAGGLDLTTTPRITIQTPPTATYTLLALSLTTT